MKRGFTLIEIIIVIIIVGILAAVGMTQYSTVVEKGRTAEAKVRLGAMSKLAYEYYLNNGSLTGITSSDVGVVGGGCSSTNFFSYTIGWFLGSASDVYLTAVRCTSGGKTPNASVQYVFSLHFNAQTGTSSWCCNIVGGGNCGLGYPVNCNP